MKKSIGLFCLLLLIDSCINRLDIENVAQEKRTLVVEGQITDAPGPYQVKLFNTSVSDAVLSHIQLLGAKQVTIFSDAGESETLVRNEAGIYETSASGIKGQIGRSYAVRVEMQDGSIYESTPDLMRPVGSIDNLYYRWESFKPLNGPIESGFRIFLDVDSPQEQTFIRWRSSGTYVVEAFPEQRRLNDKNCSTEPPRPDPPACSGWRWTLANPDNPFSDQGALEYVSECTCCVCYITEPEMKPNLSEDVITTNGAFKEIEIGFVPFNEWTFGRGRYMVKVEQMSLSQNAYDFWKVFKDQKDGASSLFQPTFGKTKTNLFATTTDNPVTGIFYASAVRKKVIFLTADDAQVKVPPYSIEPIDNCVLWNSCERLTSFNASRNPPPEWE